MSIAPEKLSAFLILTALILTAVEGAIRKWVIGTDVSWPAYLAYFSKDIVFSLLLLIPASGRVPQHAKSLTRWFTAGCVLTLLGAWLSSAYGVNPVGSILTLRAGVFLPVIALLILKKNISFSIKSIATILALLTIINFALGVVQNRTGAESVLNRYAAPNVAITVVETGVRATGTFSFISGLGVMAMVGIWAGLVLLSLRNSTAYRFLGGCSIIAGFGCSLAAVSRGPILVGAVMVAVWLAFVRLGISSTVRLSIAAALVILMLAVSGLIPILGDLGSGLIQRNESAGDSFQERAFGQFGEMYDAITLAPLGNGLGSEQVAGNYFAKGEARFGNFENQLPRVVMETGVIGLFGFLLTFIGMLTVLQDLKRKSPRQANKSILLVTQLFIGFMVYLDVMFDHVTSAFIWIIFVSVVSSQFPRRDASA